jgi:hypothetical protein
MPNTALGTSVVFVATVLDNRTFSPEGDEEDASSLLLVVDDAFLPARRSEQHKANILLISSRCFVSACYEALCALVDLSIRKARGVVIVN